VIIKDAALAHGVRNVGTHTLRKTFGYHFYQQFKDPSLLQEFFGHTDPAVTLKYIGLNQDALDAAIRGMRFNVP
jgi:integrase